MKYLNTYFTTDIKTNRHINAPEALRDFNFTGSYALTEKDDTLYAYEGESRMFATLDALEQAAAQHDRPVLFMNPFNSIKERGFEALGDERVLALFTTKITVIRNIRSHLQEVLSAVDLELERPFEASISDEDFAAQVDLIMDNEITNGDLCQVILSRVFKAKFKDFNSQVPLDVFYRLLQQQGQYLTFLFSHRPNLDELMRKSFVGASPEQHLGYRLDPKTGFQSEQDERSVSISMMPIAGTLSKKGLDTETLKKALIDFINDPKETNELFMVLDEELKMMSKLCPEGGRIKGPFLRESGGVIHTEYRLEGSGDGGAFSGVQALKQTLHAPTLVGGPVESAARTIAHKEKHSRRYYGGEIGLIQPGGNFDSAIAIRTAEIDGLGNVAIQAGAGIVRDSESFKEAEETTRKAAGLQTAILSDQAPEMLLTPTLKHELESLMAQVRNRHLSRYHFDKQEDMVSEIIAGKRILVLDNEDDFSGMLGQMIRRMGGLVEIVKTLDFTDDLDDYDLVFLGPGPGDINEENEGVHAPKINRLNQLTPYLLSVKSRAKVLGVCLGHQAIAKSLGFSVCRQKHPDQGVQKVIDLNGVTTKVGCYNSFVPFLGETKYKGDRLIDEADQVMALQTSNFESFQFHPESVLSEDGYDILKQSLERLLKH